MINLLEQLHVCGERLFDALIENDLELALQLLSDRESLMEQVAAVHEKPDEEALHPLVASLRAQNERISDALELRKQVIENALSNSYRLRRGQASYATPPSRRKVLHAGLNA